MRCMGEEIIDPGQNPVGDVVVKKQFMHFAVPG